jgi:Sulfotransferase domain
MGDLKAMQTVQRLIRSKWQTLSTKSLRFSKNVYQFAKLRKISDRKTILFIFGCQRSGTTLLTEIFDRDFDNTKVYEEFSRLSSGDKRHHIRLNPLHLVKARIDKDRPALIILKPLVESQNAVKLLDYFKNSKALWVYRHYGDVTRSNLEKWGSRNGINNLRPIVEGQSQNWRSEHVSDASKHTVRKHFSEDMNPYDAAALFWFVRNSLFFEMNLDTNENVMVCKYDNLINNPLKTIRTIYDFAGFMYPFPKIPLKIRSDSMGRGKDVKLSHNIEILCNDMMKKLDLAHKSMKPDSAHQIPIKSFSTI